MIRFLLICFIISSCNVVSTLTGEESQFQGKFDEFNFSPTGNYVSTECHYTPDDAASTALQSGLIEFFHFEETSGNRFGATGNYQLNEVGSVNSITSVCGNGVETSTIDLNNYLDLSDRSIFNFGTSTSFTISFWARFEPTTDGYQYIVGDDNNFTQDFYIAFYNGSNTVTIEAWLMGGGAKSVSAAFTADSTWHHFAFVFDRANGTNIYLDNNPIYSDATATSTVNLVETANQYLLTSIYYSNSAPIYGAVDEFGLWSRALAPAEVSQLYNLEYNF